MRTQGRLPPPKLPGLIAAVGVVACWQGPLEANGIPSHTFSITAGRELDLTLQTIGPGEYASPPQVSSGVVRFLDVRPVSPPVPAGATQQFRFATAGRGVAVIVFHTAQGPTIEDTVDVR